MTVDDALNWEVEWRNKGPITGDWEAMSALAGETRRLRDDVLVLQARAEDAENAVACAKEDSERLRAELRDHLESEAAETMRADRMRAERDALRDDNHVLRMRAEDAENALGCAKADAEVMAKMLDAVKTLNCGPDDALHWWSDRGKFVSKYLYAAIDAARKQKR